MSQFNEFLESHLGKTQLGELTFIAAQFPAPSCKGHCGGNGNVGCWCGRDCPENPTGCCPDYAQECAGKEEFWWGARG